MKWLIEVLDGEGNWNKFNYFEGTFSQVQEKMSVILPKTKYLGIKCSLFKK